MAETQAVVDKAHPIWGTGRRKTAVARVRLFPGAGVLTINSKSIDEYFPLEKDRQSARASLEATEVGSRYDIIITVAGGGISGQADAVKLGIARALVKVDESLLDKLREGSLLTRDSRMKERKKPGQKGARKKFQFSKR